MGIDRRRWLRAGGIAVAILAVLWLLGWLALPGLAKRQLEQRGSQVLGRAVTLGDLAIEPWALRVTLSDLRVAGAQGQAEPLLTVKRAMVDADWRSLTTMAPVLEAVEIDAPRVRVSRVDTGRYDIDDLLTRLAPDPNAPPTPPARFAVYNVQLRDGAIEVDDRPVKRLHKLDGLALDLPFLSNLPDQVAVKVQPRVAFSLDGSRFDSGAVTTPFAPDRATELKLRIDNLQLEPWIGYLPRAVPVRPQRGRVDADLAVSFLQPSSGAPQITVSGLASLSDFALTHADGSALVAWQRLQVPLTTVQPLARRVDLGAVRLQEPQVELRRDAQGVLKLPGAGADAPAAAAMSAASSASAPSAALAPPSADAGWTVSLASFELARGKVNLQDATTRPAARLGLHELQIHLDKPRWPVAEPVALRGTTVLVHGDGVQPAGKIGLTGQVSDRVADLALVLDEMKLDAARPYLSGLLRPRVDGQLAASGRLQWASGKDARLQASLSSLKLQDLKIVDVQVPRGPAVSWRMLELGEVQVDALAHRLSLGQVKLVQPRAMLARDAQGQLNVQRWLAQDARSGAPPARATSAKEVPWQVEVNDAQIEGGHVQWQDAVPTDHPVALVVDRLRLGARGVRWPTDARTAMARLQIQAQISPLRAERGGRPSAVQWQGQVRPDPLRAQGRLTVDRFPVQAVEGYFADQLPVDLLRAEAGWRGDLTVAQEPRGLTVSARGEALVGDLHVAARARPGTAAGDELLNWQSLALQGVDLAITPGAKPRIDIGEIALSDFYASLLVTEQGQLNLQQAVAAPAAVASAPPASMPPAPDRTSAAVAASASAPASAPPAAALPIDLTVGRTRVVNGKVDFADRFIRPNYSAALTELTGSLGRFSSASPELAALELRGRAAGTALLEITGSLNPAARPMALDISAKATDLELAPLSPYAGKYAGYAIERGKLSMAVRYNIQPDGRLDASNQVVLNQLTFGDKVDSPEATKLPVLLAVALLKDRHGVIDINLPITGSINDPQFSVAGIVIKVILNLLTKALTAPFALLAGGGGEDLSLAEFVPGTARLTDKGRATIDKVAQALADRPALKMTVTGASDPASERAAMQADALESRVRAEHRREKLRAGAASDAPVPAPTAEERGRIVKAMYGDAKLPNKPRNAVGWPKDIPVAEMEGLLRAAVLVSTDTARELALQRGLAVRDALIAKGLPSERLFLAAPKLRASGEDDASWTPRVQLSLSTQ